MAPEKKHRSAPRRFIDPSVLSRISNLDLIARNVVEGFIAGLHKSPFKGFSVEFMRSISVWLAAPVFKRTIVFGPANLEEIHIGKIT